MPAANRASIETVDIGRGNHYEARNPQSKPTRRSSTLRSDEWDYYDRSTPYRYDRYDDYRPRYEVVDVYEAPGRPARYQDDYYDRGHESSGPVRRYVSQPHTRRGVEREVFDVRNRRRSPSPVIYHDDERIITADRSRRGATKPAAPVGHTGPSKAANEPPHVPGLFQTVFDVNQPQDASVHLELPITDDHNAELEEFCRLQRLGNFGAAEDYFKNKLESYLSNPYIFVQYGQMLLEKGDYIAFERLNSEAVFGIEDQALSRVREEIVVVERDRSRPRVRSRSRSWSRSRERRRETRARSRSQSPVEGGRQERRARFESDVRIVRRRSRSRSPPVDNIQRYYERERYVESDRSDSPERQPQLRDTKSDPGYDELELLRQNWRLLKATSTIYSKGNYDDAVNEAWDTIENFHFGTGIGSTEIHVMKLALQLCAKFGRIDPEWYHRGLREAARAWIDWQTIFKDLLVQGRIWDFKDLYVACVAAFSDSEDMLLFETDDIKRSLIDDWVLEDGDESTDLALLDMLLEPGSFRSYFPNEAKLRAEAIIAHSPAVMRSRSFIRWILANAADALSGEKKGDDDSWLAFRTHLQGFPGVVWNTGSLFLPGVYVPRNAENPGWVASELSPGMIEPIQLALNLAKELKDYNAQVACYKLLIFQSQNPTQLFEELAQLQKSMQGDKKGHLETLLSSYLVRKDRPGKERLLEELAETDDWGDATILRDGLTYWARDFIERAVKRSLQGPKSMTMLRNPASFYMDKGLSWQAEQFTWQNTELDRLPPTSVHPTETHIRRTPGLPPRNPSRAHQQGRIRPYSRPPSPYRQYHLRPEPPRQSLSNPRRDELYIDRRRQEETEREERELARLKKELQALREKEEREEAEKQRKELDRAKRELQAMKEKQDREAKNRQDTEMRERLEQAERRLGEQEEINKKQIEDMRRRDMEMGQLEQEFKQEQERQKMEARAQQERATRERLERAELSLRDQGERLRRAEDRSYREWLAARDLRRKSNARGKVIRGRKGARFVASSSASSESYSSDNSPSRDNEDTSDDTSIRTRGRGKRTSSGSDEESEQEIRINRRVRSVEELRSEPTRNEAEQQVGEDTGNLQRNSCTDLILYREAQDIRSPDAHMVGNRSSRLPTSPVSSPDEARARNRRGSTTELRSTNQQTQTDPQEQIDNLTAEPQEVEDEPEDTGDGASSSVRRAESRDRSQLRSKEQNAKIANRPSRPNSTSIYISPRPSVDDSTGIWDAWEETRRKKAHRRVIIDPGPSGAHTASPRPRSRPSSTQVYDDIQPLGRRASWRDSPIGSPHGDRLGSPTKRRSLIIDADGRPQPVRTTSERGRSYAGDSSGGTYVRVIRSDADGNRPIPIPIPEISATAAGSRARPHSTEGVGTRRHPPGPETSAPEKQSADSWERVKDGLWRKRKPSTLHEDPEEGEEWGLPQSKTRGKQGESSKEQESLDPDQGISRKSTVADPEPSEE